MLAGMAIPAFAQDAVKPTPLTKEEQEVWAQLQKSEQELAQALDQTLQRAVNTPVGTESQAIHASIQQAALALNLLRTRRDGFIWKLRAEKSCPNCVIDNGALVAPPKEN